jgi:MFS family permease
MNYFLGGGPSFMSELPSTDDSSLKAVLAQSSFRKFLSARFLSAIAIQMQTVAVGLQVYSLTHDPMDLGLVGLSQFAPFLMLVLFAGQAADRWTRKYIVLGCFIVQWVCAGVLFLLTYLQVPQVWPVFVVMCVFGVTRAFVMPASQALTPNLIPHALFRKAIVVNSSTWQIATIAGPAIGGLAYGLYGPLFVYGCVLALTALSIGAIVRMQSPPQPVPAGQATWQTVLHGVQFVFKRPILLGATSLDLFAVLFGGATALLPAYATDILLVGPEGLGWLRAAPGIGAAVIAAVLAYRPMGRNVGWALFVSVAVFGAATIVFGLSHSFWVSLVALAVLGGADMISVFVRQLLVQLDTPDDMRGRVGAVSVMFIGASNELGEFESGATAAWWGLVPAVVLGGAATIAIAALWTRLFPTLRRMDQFPAPSGSSAGR